MSIRHLLFVRLMVSFLLVAGVGFVLATRAVVFAGTLSSISVAKTGGGYLSQDEQTSLSISFTTASEVPVGGFVGIYLPSGFAFASTQTLSVSNLQIDGVAPDPNSFGFDTNFSQDLAHSYRVSDVHLLLKTQGSVISAGSTVSFTLSSITVGNTCEVNQEGWIATYQTDGSTFIDGGWTNNETGSFTVVVCTPAVIGRVVDPSGNPVADAWVNVRSSDWSTYQSASTGTDGKFYFFNLSQATGMVLEVYAPSTASYYDANPVSFNIPTLDSQPYDHGDVSLTRPSLVGRVYAPDGTTPLANVGVSVHDSRWQVSKWSNTDDSGSFRIGGLGNGTYQLEVSAPWDSEGLIPPDPFSFTTVVGETVYYDGEAGHNSAIVFVQANKTIVGKVTKANGAVISNALVEAYKEQGSGWAQATTNADGEYTLEVGKGKWLISPRPNYEGDYASVDWTYNKSAIRVSFSADDDVVETQTVNFTVQVADCVISGKITDPNGNMSADLASQIWVGAWSSVGGMGGMGGNSAMPSSDGSFSLRVPEGSYELSVDTWHSSYGSPSRINFAVEDADEDGSCDGYNAGTIKLLERNSTVSGLVKDSNGNAVGGIRVSAWKFEGHGWAEDTTDATGAYSLETTPGTWIVSISTDPGMMSSGYNPKQTTYIFDGAPLQVTVTDGAVSTQNNFTVKIADATIKGRVVDSTGNTLSSLEMGYAFIEIGSAGSTGYGPMMYNTIGAPIQNGTFTLKVPAGTYRVNVSPPWGAEYCTSDSKEVTVSSGDTVSTSVTLEAADATISGYLKDGTEDGATLTGVWADVSAHSGSMNYAGDNVDTETGSYSLSVCAGDWYLGYWIDPSLGYLSESLAENKVTVAAGETKTKNIVAKKADATIGGTVQDPDGNPLGGVWVSVDTRSNDKVGGGFSRDEWFHHGSMSDSSGHYSIDVPSGNTYYLEAYWSMTGYGSTYTDYISPPRTPVTPESNETVTVDLQFKRADATLKGQVTQDGTPRAAFVTGWSEDGGYSSTTTDADGNYTLLITSDTNWHVKAVYESSTSFARSKEHILSVASGEVGTQDLILSEEGSLPDSVTVTFAATNQKTITLSDGATITIPAGALASSGNVTVTVEPKAQLPSQSLANPISFGYDITALDSNGAEITGNFNSNVTIVFPYSEDDLTEFGISENDLLAGYWDESANAWRPVGNVSIDKENNTVTISINHFTDFSIFAAGTTDSSAPIAQTTDSTLTPTPTPTPTPTVTEAPTPTTAVSATQATQASLEEAQSSTTSSTATGGASLPTTGVSIVEAAAFYLSRLVTVAALLVIITSFLRKKLLI